MMLLWGLVSFAILLETHFANNCGSSQSDELSPWLLGISFVSGRRIGKLYRRSQYSHHWEV